MRKGDKIMSKYIWFSPATDITGKKLAESLNLQGTKVKPTNLTANDIVIGWGTKTKVNVDFGPAKVINHPNNILINRNKLKQLDFQSL